MWWVKRTCSHLSFQKLPSGQGDRSVFINGLLVNYFVVRKPEVSVGVEVGVTEALVSEGAHHPVATTLVRIGYSPLPLLPFVGLLVSTEPEDSFPLGVRYLFFCR